MQRGQAPWTPGLDILHTAMGPISRSQWSLLILSSHLDSILACVKSVTTKLYVLFTDRGILVLDTPISVGSAPSSGCHYGALPCEPCPPEFLMNFLLHCDLPQTCDSPLLTLSTALGHTNSNTATGNRRVGPLTLPLPLPGCDDSVTAGVFPSPPSISCLPSPGLSFNTGPHRAHTPRKHPLVFDPIQ